MRLLRTSLRPLLLAALGGAACDGTAPDPGGSPGGLALVTTTAGLEPDSDGYTIMVDGERRGTIGPNDSVAVPGVEPGSHAVALADIEFNCATLGQFTRTVPVTSEAASVVDYSVACDALSRSRIGFVRNRSSDPEIFVMNADGSSLTSLEDSVGAVVAGFLPPVSWSADGTRMAFTRFDGGLYATTGEGTTVVRLASAGMSPRWTGDGRKVAFLGGDAWSQPCCGNLFVAESDGSTVARVTEGLALHDYDFAANGSLLAYVADPTTPTSVVVVHPDGTGAREIAPPGIRWPQRPALSPDGTRVAYFAWPEVQGDDGPGYEIYVSPTDGTGAAIDLSRNAGNDWLPVWSPDGTRIAFLSSAPGLSYGPGALQVVNADGTGRIILAPADMFVGGLAWSPDGARIAYTGVVDGQEHVLVANADGSGRTDVTPGMESSHPTWTGR